MTLIVLGAAGIGVIVALDGVTAYRRRLRFRSISWRLSWWASWLSVLVGVVLSAFFCGSPANALVVEAGVT